MPAIGTPGFEGARLREARDARGLSMISLAELIGTSRQVIWQYEHGRTAPTPDRLYLIAAKLSLPVDYFLQPPRPETPRVVFYRSRADTTKGARGKAEARLEWLGDIVRYLMAYVEFPPVSIPDMAEEISNRKFEPPFPREFTERAAAIVREAWGLDDGPIPNVTSLLETHGVITSRGVMETQMIDAFSVWLADDRPCVFLGADKDSAARSRFDAVHELAHAVLHRGTVVSTVTRATAKHIEADAHRFAGAFLLPPRGFAHDLRSPTLEAMSVAKSRWVVSIGAMIRRCEDLEILLPREAERLWIARAKRGWARHEPLDDELPVERPAMLRRAMELIVSEGLRTPAHVSSDLRLYPNDIQSLVGLEERFFDEGPPPVQLLDRMGRGTGGGRQRGSRVVGFSGASGGTIGRLLPFARSRSVA